MNILCIGDLHFRSEESENVNLFISNMNQYFQSNKNIDIIVLLGDILHSHEKIYSESMNLAIRFFKCCKQIAPTYCIVGNHDFTNNSGFLKQNHWLNACKEWDNFFVVDTPTYYTKQLISNSSIQLLFIPYVPDGSFLKALNVADMFYPELKWMDSHVIFAHQLFDGANMGSIVTKNVESWDEDYPLCISGHIHTKQKVQPNLYYTGSSLYTSYSDLTKKSLLLLSLQYSETNLTIKMKDVDTGIPRKLVYTFDLDEEQIQHQIEEKLKKLNKNKIDQTKISGIKFIIKGLYENLKHFKSSSTYKHLIQSGIKVVLKCKTIINASDNRSDNSNSDSSSVKIDFIECLKQNISDNEELKNVYKKFIQY
jgi:DNA repair exonuclease SbcCD nuclease subunit